VLIEALVSGTSCCEPRDALESGARIEISPDTDALPHAALFGRGCAHGSTRCRGSTTLYVGGKTERGRAAATAVGTAPAAAAPSAVGAVRTWAGAGISSDGLTDETLNLCIGLCAGWCRSNRTDSDTRERQ
jgi:hypothetical protein